MMALRTLVNGKSIAYDGKSMNAIQGAAMATDEKFEDLAKGLLKAELSDSLTLNSITAYRQFHALEILDADGTSLPVRWTPT